MSGYKKFLQERNRFSSEGETEVLGHFTKSAKAYFLRAFFGKFFWHSLIFIAVCCFLLLTGILMSDGKRDVFFYLSVSGVCFGLFAYVVNVLMKTHQWKYVKHVIVTDEGIWLGMCFFTGHWSVYDWAELSGIFEEQCKISEIYKLKDIVMVRWDGEQVVRFLKPEDFDAIMRYGDEKINPRKRKPRDEKPQRKWWEFFLREE